MMGVGVDWTGLEELTVDYSTQDKTRQGRGGGGNGGVTGTGVMN